MRDRLANELPMHGLAFRRPPDRRLRRETLNRLTHRVRVRGRRQRLADREVNAVRNLLRPLPKELPALIAEDAAPDVIDANRNDRRRAAFDDLLEPALKGQQEAGARDAPLREDAHDLAFRQCLTGSAQRLDDGARAARPLDRNDVGHAHEKAEPPDARVGRPHEKANLAFLPGKDQERIDVADVIRDQERRPRFGNVLETLHAQSVEGATHDPQRQSNEEEVAKHADEDEEENQRDQSDPPRINEIVPEGEIAEEDAHAEAPIWKKLVDANG